MPRSHRAPFGAPLDIKSVTADGLFEGYASLFHREDLGRDIILPGAFRDSLAKRGAAGIKMLFQHDPTEPIGVWDTIYEDAKGLFVRGRLLTSIARGRETLALMQAGALDGLSIGFKPISSSRSTRGAPRRIAKLDLWEISVVTFPMMPEARVAAIKSSRPARMAASHAEFQRWLTRDCGFTIREADAFLDRGLPGLHALHGTHAAHDLSATLRAATQRLSA